MGKKLIIHGANFSANAIDLGNWTDISSGLLFTNTKRQYLHYPNNSINDAFQYGSTISARIAYIDVEDYVGMNLRLKAPAFPKSTDYTGGAYWICFASEFNVTMPYTGTTSKYDNALDAVSRVSGNGGSGMYEYILEVPQGANWLVFTDEPSKGTPKVEVEITQ